MAGGRPGTPSVAVSSLCPLSSSIVFLEYGQKCCSLSESCSRQMNNLLDSVGFELFNCSLLHACPGLQMQKIMSHRCSQQSTRMILSESGPSGGFIWKFSEERPRRLCKPAVCNLSLDV